MKTGATLIFLAILLTLPACSWESDDLSAPQLMQKSSVFLQFEAKLMGIGL